MKTLLAALTFIVPLATVSVAQDFGDKRQFSVDLGLGVAGVPTYPGADDATAQPWLIWRNARFGADSGVANQGFSISPSFRLIGPRNADDDIALAGLTEIDRALELGARVRYDIGPMGFYGTVRRGFGGHEGIAGEVGTSYRTDLSDQLTLWSGLEFGYGNSDFNDTYFGVTPAESLSSGYQAYQPGDGFSSAAIKFQARYNISELTAILGEVEYGKIVGDSADSPIVQDEYQPALRLGIVRKLSFGF